MSTSAPSRVSIWITPAWLYEELTAPHYVAVSLLLSKIVVIEILDELVESGLYIDSQRFIRAKTETQSK